MPKTKSDQIVLGKSAIYKANDTTTGLNDNVVIVGSSGSGKTRSIVEPTLLSTNDSNLIVSDPKGRLADRYKEYFEQIGYKTIVLDFIHPEESETGYDPIQFLCAGTRFLSRNKHITKRTQKVKDREIFSLSNMMIHTADTTPKRIRGTDPFWADMSAVLLSSIIATVVSYHGLDDRSMEKVLAYTDGYAYSGLDGHKSLLKLAIDKIREYDPESYAVRQYSKIEQMPSKTMGSVFSTASSILGSISSEDLLQFYKKPQINLNQFFHETQKTIIFVKTSDVDDSIHYLANLFYSQFMQLMFEVKDHPTYRDTRPCRFILDDFGSTVNILKMPQWSSMMRERGISVMLILQSITQLESVYGEADARTILSNCDNIAYLRSNDLATAREFAERLSERVEDILYTPPDTVYIMRAGERPVKTNRYDIRKHPAHKKLKYKTYDTITQKMAKKTKEKAETIVPLGFQLPEIE